MQMSAKELGPAVCMGHVVESRTGAILFQGTRYYFYYLQYCPIAQGIDCTVRIWYVKVIKFFAVIQIIKN
jgi:hypothetical protein